MVTTRHNCGTNHQTTTMMKVIPDTHVSLSPPCIGMMFSSGWILHNNYGAVLQNRLLWTCLSLIKGNNRYPMSATVVFFGKFIWPNLTQTWLPAGGHVFSSVLCIYRDPSKQSQHHGLEAKENIIRKPSTYPRDTTGDSVKAFRTHGWKYAKHQPPTPSSSFGSRSSCPVGIVTGVESMNMDDMEKVSRV